MILSISNLLSVLLGRVPTSATSSEVAKDENAEPDNRRIATTIRLDPQVKSFVERNASTLGLSIQDFMAMTMRAVMVASESPKISELDLMVSRFFDLFDAHEINTSDIPLFLPTGTLNRADLEHRDRVINALDRKTIKFLSDEFLISPEWLSGASNTCENRGRIPQWYKSPASFARRLLVYKLQNNVSRVSVAFITKDNVNLAKLDDARKNEDAISAIDITPVILLQTQTDGLSVTKYEVWETQRWNYSKCRMDLKAIMLLCQRAHVMMDGITLPIGKYDDFVSSRSLPAIAFKRPYKAFAIDDVVWDSESNLERNELAYLESHYKSEKMEIFQNAISNYYAITNIEKVAACVELPRLKGE